MINSKASVDSNDSDNFFLRCFFFSSLNLALLVKQENGKRWKMKELLQLSSTEMNL